MKTICLANQKGGVAKTTTATALAQGLARRNYKVLFIDSDPQCNATFNLGINPLEVEYTLNDIYEKTTKAENIIIKINDNLDLIAGNLILSVADLKYSMKPSREYILSKGLENIKENYDYCIIDTPPHIALLVLNALAMTDLIIIPLTADVYSIQGLAYFTRLLNEIESDLVNSKFKIDGLLLTRIDNRSNLSKTLQNQVEEIAKKMKLDLYKTRINESIKVGEAALFQKDLFIHSKKSKTSKDYESFIDEFIERN